jgi:hypothetical protein
MSILLIILVFLAIVIGHLLLKNYEIQLFGGNPPSKQHDFMSTMSVSLIPGARIRSSRCNTTSTISEQHPCPHGPATCSLPLKMPYTNTTTINKKGEIDELTAMKDELAEFIGVNPSPKDPTAISQGSTCGNSTLIRPDSQFVTTQDGSVAYIEGSALHRPIRQHPQPPINTTPTIDGTVGGDYAAANFTQYDSSDTSTTPAITTSIANTDQLGVFSEGDFGSFASWK